MRDYSFRQETIEIAYGPPRHDAFFTCSIERRLTGPPCTRRQEEVDAVVLDGRVREGRAERLDRRGAVAGLLEQLALGSDERILAGVDHAARRLQRDLPHARPVLLDEHELALLGHGDDVRPVRARERGHLLRVAVLAHVSGEQDGERRVPRDDARLLDRPGSHGARRVRGHGRLCGRTPFAMMTS